MHEDFENKIQKDIQGREAVLFEVEIALFTQRYSLSVKHQEILCTQAIAIIYSVWEGFVQVAFSLYVDEINSANLNLYQLCDEIIIHHMENSFKQMKEYPAKDSQKAKFFKDLKIFHDQPASSISRVINTNGNVGFHVLNNLLKTFALTPFTEHWELYTYPKPNLKDSLALLLKLRNTVAHGGDLMPEEKVSQAVYDRFKKLIADLMYETSVRMLQGLASKSYLAKDIL